MFYVHMLHSTKDNGFYISYSTNLKRWLSEHARGASFATKSRGPSKLTYYEPYTEREDAEAEGPSKTLRLTRSHPYLEKMDSDLAGGFAPYPGDAGGGGAIHQSSVDAADVDRSGRRNVLARAEGSASLPLDRSPADA